MGWVFLLMMLSSCVNDLPYDEQIGLPRLVLNALLLPDSTITATVGRTAHFLDSEEPQRLADATVTAVVNGVSLPLVYSADTKDYRSTYVLRSGDKVVLTASHAIGSATATAQVMAPVPLAVVHTAMQPFTNPGDPVRLATLNEVDSAMLVSLYVDDPADETNYYRLTIDYYGTYLVTRNTEIYGKYNQDRQDDDSDYFVSEENFYPHYLLTESSSRLFIDSESASQLLGGLLYLTSCNSLVFTDEQLRSTDGQTIVDFLMLMESPRTDREMLDPESGWLGGDEWPDGLIFPSDTVSHVTYHYDFVLETLSEDYYCYLSTVSSYGVMGGTFVGEPTHIYTNVSGGLGIVGSYSSTSCGGDREFAF